MYVDIRYYIRMACVFYYEYILYTLYILDPKG